MYFRYMRMSPRRFKHLLTLIAPKITKKNKTTNYREPFLPDQRLSLTLRHLATGESQISLSLQYRIGRQTISKIIPETCKQWPAKWGGPGRPWPPLNFCRGGQQ